MEFGFYEQTIHVYHGHKSIYAYLCHVFKFLFLPTFFQNAVKVAADIRYFNKKQQGNNMLGPFYFCESINLRSHKGINYLPS